MSEKDATWNVRKIANKDTEFVKELNGWKEIYIFRGTESKLNAIQNIDDYTMMCNGIDKSDRSGK
jgi:hypothetical protein